MFLGALHSFAAIRLPASLLTPKKGTHDFFGLSDGAGYAGLRKVVRVQARNVLLLRGGLCFLGLDHFHRVGNAGREAVSGLSEFILGKLPLALRNANLLRGGGEIQVCVSNVRFDTSAQVVVFGAALRQCSVGL